MRYDRVVWDFNGTIYDDAEIGMRVFNAMLSRRGLRLISDMTEYRAVFGFPVENTYKALSFDLTNESFDAIAVEFHAEYDRLFPEAGLTAGITDIFDLLKREHIPQHVLSATEQSRLSRILCTLGIEDYFESAFGIENLRAESKTGVAERRFGSMKDSRMVFIGDTAHDAEAARAAGAECILVTWGHQNAAALRKTGVSTVSAIHELISALTG